MTARGPTKPFTGKHMAVILASGFGVVIAVNLTMASLATSGFQGTVVDNSYAASQKYNTWLEQAKADEALGWAAELSRDEAGYVLVDPRNIPPGAAITAELRRPIGTREYASLTFTPLPDRRFRSDAPVAPGRWTIRLRIEAGGDQWAQESELPRKMRE